MGPLLHPVREGWGKHTDGAFLTAEASVEDADCAGRIIDALAYEKLAHVLVFASPTADVAHLMRRLQDAFDCAVVGCTTAGEIGAEGYVTDRVLAIGLPSHSFAARTVLLEDVTGMDLTAQTDRLIQARIALTAANPKMTGGFSFLMVDGMSRREDALVSAIAPTLAGFPLFGGSAGDGLRFQSSSVALRGEIHENAATLTFVATTCETRVFSINHMSPTDIQMVVTEADPEARVVHRINAEPAAVEYARLIGKDPAQLDELIFAAHPVTVCIGGQYHVRAIQRVTDEGHLVFFSAIDEGMVLTVSAPNDMAAHLDKELSQLVNGHAKPSILSCDCVLRRIEAERNQTVRKVNETFRKHAIVGFSTYGEQIGTLHVNHTMTGVAIFPPERMDDR